MRLTWTSTSRLPRWPVWGVGLLFAWAGLMSLAGWLVSQVHPGQSICLFKRVTGLPCATCGLTRGMLNLLQGRPAIGWAHNPLWMTVAALTTGILAVRLATGKAPRLETTPRQRAWLLWGAVAVFLLNWVYVIAWVG
jgi:hypothetical protein